MNKLWHVNGKLSLLLITAIFILCAGFLVISCGDPQQKAKKTDKGAFAVDFSRCPVTDPKDFCSTLSEGSDVNPAANLSDTELTIEAWVKSRTATLNGGIFSRMDAARGVTLYVKNNEPKLAIRVMTAVTSTPGAPTPTASYIVGSGFTLVQDVWTHIAGLLVNQDHSAVHADCIDELGMIITGRDESPHLDMYVDGEYKNCGTTFGYPGDPANGIPADPATGPQFTDNPGHQQMVVSSVQAGPLDGVSSFVNATIDEVRLWLTGRTAAEILACKDKELGIGGTCDRGDSNLAAYYRFNEGEGSDITDFSGNGLSGSVLSFAPDEEHWDDGWVDGNTGLQRAD